MAEITRSSSSRTLLPSPSLPIKLSYVKSAGSCAMVRRESCRSLSAWAAVSSGRDAVDL